VGLLYELDQLPDVTVQTLEGGGGVRGAGNQEKDREGKIGNQEKDRESEIQRERQRERERERRWKQEKGEEEEVEEEEEWKGLALNVYIISKHIAS